MGAVNYIKKSEGNAIQAKKVKMILIEKKPLNGKLNRFELVIANKDVKYGQKHENSLFFVKFALFCLLFSLARAQASNSLSFTHL